MQKLKWNLLIKKHNLYSILSRTKYGNNLNKKAYNPSFIRRSIDKDLSLINYGISWTIGNGNNINFWSDP